MAAELKIGIGADNTGLKQGLQDAEAQITAFVNKVGKIGQIGEDLSRIGQKMTIGLTAPILALGAGAIKAYGDLQSLEMGLKAVMGTSAAATGELEKLRQVAKLPGLGLQEAVKGSVALQSAGFSANEARRSLMAFGNALATVGKGANELGLVNLALTQIQNKAGGFGQDLRQLTEQLPQLRGAMQAAFGTVDSEKVAELGYTGKQVVQMLTTEFEKLPKVTGGIKNAFENLKDNMFITFSKIGKIIDDNFDISGIIDKITGFVDKLISAFEGLSPAMQKTILVVTGLVAAAGPLLIAVGAFMQFLPTLLAGIGGISAAMTFLTGPIGLVTVGIIGIVAAVAANWNKITPYLVRTANNFIELYNESQEFRAGILSIGFAFESLYAVVKSFVKSAWQTFMNFGKGVLNLFEGISLMIRGAFNKDPKMIAEGWEKANTKVVMSFDNVGAAIGRVYDKYDKLQANKKPLKLVTEADLSINTDKAAETISTQLQKAAKKATAKPLQIELPDIEPLAPIKTEGFMNAFGETFATLQEMENRTAQLAAGITTNLAQIPTAFSDIQLSVTENIFKLQESFAAMADFGNFLGQAIQTSFNFVVDTITNSFSAIGEAMATGGNLFSAVGNAVLGGIGSFLGDLGKQMVQYGVASLAFAILTKLLASNPITAAPAAVAMIAAGAALSAVSGAIKGTLSKGSSSGSSAGSSGGGFSSAAGGSSSYSSNYSSAGSGMGGDVRFFISGNDLMGVLSRQQDKNTRLN